MPKVLTPDQINAYRRDGYSFPHLALSEDDAARQMERLEAFEETLGGRLGDVGGA